MGDGVPLQTHCPPGSSQAAQPFPLARPKKTTEGPGCDTVGVRVGVDVKMLVGVLVMVGETVGKAVCVGEGEMVDVAGWVGVSVAGRVSAAVGDGVGVSLAVADAVGPVGVMVGVPAVGVLVVGVPDSVAVNEGVAVPVPPAGGWVGVAVRVAVGVPEDPPSSPSSAGRSAALIRLSPFTSAPLQLLPFIIAAMSALTSAASRTPLQSASPGSAAATGTLASVQRKTANTRVATEGRALAKLPLARVQPSSPFSRREALWMTPEAMNHTFLTANGIEPANGIENDRLARHIALNRGPSEM